MNGEKIFMQNLIRKLEIIYYSLIKPAIKKLTKESEKRHSIEDFVNLAFNFKVGIRFKGIGLHIRPLQVKEEILKLAETVMNLKPKFILEIGTANGGTLFLWTRIASEDAHIISIDLPGGLFGGGYPKCKIPLYKSFSKEKQKIYLITKDSHNPQTLKEVERILDGERVDFLFIDGDHTYKGVKKDFEGYSPLVREGGIIAFHDICSGSHECVGGVPKFWNEIKQHFNFIEIVKDRNQKGYGIGVLYI
jgi:predicted O-methyltransferase YrrM